MGYRESIADIVGCLDSQAAVIENIMRDDVLHSTLDSLTPKQFRNAALEAWDLYVEYVNDGMMNQDGMVNVDRCYEVLEEQNTIQDAVRDYCLGLLA